MSLAEAKARLSGLVGRAEAGEEVCLSRRGQPIVRLVAIEPARKPIDREALAAFRETLPVDPTSSVVAAQAGSVVSVYCDTSLMISVLTTEVHTNVADRWFRAHASEALGTSRWIDVEVANTSAVKARRGVLSEGERRL